MTAPNPPTVSSPPGSANAARACRTPTIPRRSTMPAASAWSRRSTASRRRDVVEAGIEALKAVWHRGAVDADGKTGDGAGIHVEIPQDFFAEAVERGGDKLRARAASPSARCSCRRPISARRSAAADRRDRDPQLRLRHLRLAPGADQRRVHRREGQRHPPRDRADHDLASRRAAPDDARRSSATST